MRVLLRAAALALGVAALWIAPATVAAAAGLTTGWTKVVTGGFTDRNNSYAPASIVFKGWLYLSTAANQSGAIFSGSHKLGGDIWRSADGASWEQVGNPGLGNTHNMSFNFAVFHDRLYALANKSTTTGSRCG